MFKYKKGGGGCEAARAINTTANCISSQGKKTAPRSLVWVRRGPERESTERNLSA